MKKKSRKNFGQTEIPCRSGRTSNDPAGMPPENLIKRMDPIIMGKGNIRAIDRTVLGS
jgi:hypothetical protein